MKKITLQNVFQDNVAVHGGAVHAEYSSLKFAGCNFTNNAAQEGGAVYAAETKIVLRWNVHFSSNSAQNGGALYLTAATKLSLSPSDKLLTSYNIASEYGGAIYHDDTVTPFQCDFIEVSDDSFKLPDCFIDASGFPAQIYSKYNRAGKDGSFIYGGLLDKCQPSVTINVLGGNMFDIMSHNDTAKAIGSKPFYMCLCNGNWNSTSYCANNINISVHRGQTFILPIIALGQGHLPTATTITTLVSNSSRLALSQASQPLSHQCTNLTYTLYSTDISEKMLLYPDGPCRDTGAAKVTIDVTILNCPDVFTQHEGECV